MKLIFSDDAELGIERIGDWIARDNPLRAESFTAELRAACEALLIFPRRFPLIAPDSNVHKRTYRHYLILYTVEDQTVTITAVEHASRDLSRLI